MNTGNIRDPMSHVEKCEISDSSVSISTAGAITHRRSMGSITEQEELKNYKVHLKGQSRFQPGPWPARKSRASAEP